MPRAGDRFPLSSCKASSPDDLVPISLRDRVLLRLGPLHVELSARELPGAALADEPVLVADIHVQALLLPVLGREQVVRDAIGLALGAVAIDPDLLIHDRVERLLV